MPSIAHNGTEIFNYDSGTCGFTNTGQFYIRGSDMFGGGHAIQTDRGQAMEIARYIMNYGVKTGAELTAEDVQALKDRIDQLNEEITKWQTASLKLQKDCEMYVKSLKFLIQQHEKLKEFYSDLQNFDEEKHLLKAEIKELRAFRDRHTILQIENELTQDEMNELNEDQMF